MILKHSGITIEIDGEVESIELLDGLVKIKTKQAYAFEYMPYYPYSHPTSIPITTPNTAPWVPNSPQYPIVTCGVTTNQSLPSRIVSIN